MILYMLTTLQIWNHYCYFIQFTNRLLHLLATYIGLSLCMLEIHDFLKPMSFLWPSHYYWFMDSYCACIFWEVDLFKVLYSGAPYSKPPLHQLHAFVCSYEFFGPLNFTELYGTLCHFRFPRVIRFLGILWFGTYHLHEAYVDLYIIRLTLASISYAP